LSRNRTSHEATAVNYGTVALALDALIEWLTARILETRLGDAATRRRAGQPV
jgi:hypothetical protein